MSENERLTPMEIESNKGLAHSGCYNETLLAEQFINNTTLLLTILRAGISKSVYQHGKGGPSSGSQTSHCTPT